jgi:hypothetical protein
MPNTLSKKISAEMILKKGVTLKTLESRDYDFSSPEIQERLRKAREAQKRNIELKYKEFENLEIYLPPSHHNYGR